VKNVNRGREDEKKDKNQELFGGPKAIILGKKRGGGSGQRKGQILQKKAVGYLGG